MCSRRMMMGMNSGSLAPIDFNKMMKFNLCDCDCGLTLLLFFKLLIFLF